MKYYVVSDVHGFYTELIAALTQNGWFNDSEPHELILCGDMMDRGCEARSVQKFMLELLEKDELIFIRGNHEDLIMQLIQDLKKNDHLGGISNHHITNGTVNTALQLTDHSDVLYYDFWKFADIISKTPFVNTLIPASIDFFETDHYIFVHGWIPCEQKQEERFITTYEFDPDWRTASAAKWSKARWFNGMDMAINHNVKVDGKTIVCGHWHCSYGHFITKHSTSEFGDDAIFTPFYDDGIIAIDGCTAYTRKVNCIVIED